MLFAGLKLLKAVIGLTAGPISKTYLSSKEMSLKAKLEERKSANAARKTELDHEIKVLEAEIRDMKGQRAHYRATHGSWWQQGPLIIIEYAVAYAVVVMVLREAHQYAATPEWSDKTWYVIMAVLAFMTGRRMVQSHIATRRRN